jgi:hypothetical protein
MSAIPFSGPGNNSAKTALAFLLLAVAAAPRHVPVRKLDCYIPWISWSVANEQVHFNTALNRGSPMRSASVLLRYREWAAREARVNPTILGLISREPESRPRQGKINEHADYVIAQHMILLLLSVASHTCSATKRLDSLVEVVAGIESALNSNHHAAPILE